MEKKKYIAGVLALCIAAALWGCGNDDLAGNGAASISSVPVSSAVPVETEAPTPTPAPSSEVECSVEPEESFVLDLTESSPAYSSMEGLVDDLIHSGAQLPESLWLPDETKVQEAFGASYAAATCQQRMILVDFVRSTDLTALAAQYGLPENNPMAGLTTAEGLENTFGGAANDWRAAGSSLCFFSSLDTLEEAPEDGLSWEAVSGREGYETAKVMWNSAGETVRLRVRWKKDGRVLQAELPADCLEAFWNGAEGLMAEKETQSAGFGPETP